MLLLHLETFTAGVIDIQEHICIYYKGTNVQEIRRKIIQNLAVNILTVLC